MARIVLPEQLLPLTGGQREVELSAERVRDLLAALEERWPGAGQVLARSAVAIDGQIYQDAFLEKVAPDSEVFFMQRIEGG